MSNAAERLSDKRDARRRNRLCIYCGKPALPNRSLCKEHGRASRRWQRNARIRRERAPWNGDAAAEQRCLRSITDGSKLSTALAEAGVTYSKLYAWGRYNVGVVQRLRSAVDKRIERLRGTHSAVHNPIQWNAPPYDGCSACVLIDCSLRLLYEGYTRNAASALTGITVGRVESHVRRCARAALLYERVRERAKLRRKLLVTCAECGAPVKYGRPGRRCKDCRYSGAEDVLEPEQDDDLWQCTRCGRRQLAEDIWPLGGCLDCTRL